MPSPARVLILNERDADHPEAGGAEVHIVETFRRLVSQGFEVTLAASAFSGAAALDENQGIRVRRLGGLPLYYARAVGYCARATRRGCFDVVVECLNKMPFYAPVYAAAPVLAVCHHLFGETAFLQVRWPIAAAVWVAERLIPVMYRKTPFVSISTSTRDDLVARGISAECVRVIPCGAARPKIDPPGMEARKLRVVYLGRLEPYKRVDLLLHALAKLRDRFPEAELVVIGRGSEDARLRRLAEELSIARRTRFAGFVDHEKRDRLLAESRVCVCPSAKEGWGLTVIEANALATPVVASDAPGLRDSVRDGKTGFLVPYGDVDAFTDRIARLLGNDVLAAQMSSAALAWSRSFDWDRAAEGMAEALDHARGVR